MIDRSGVANVFAAEWPRLVATLVRDIGDVGLAEDAAQEAFIQAAIHWEQSGPPERPGAWLLTTARRKAIDQIRRSKRFDDRLPHLIQAADAASQSSNTDPALVDEQLALMLGCCHPALAPEAQVALTLRIVAGLSTAQIARAFFVSEQTMTRRLTRSKTKIRAANIPFTHCDVDTLHQRLPAVCAVIYSIFTEGHASATATTLLRGDLCDEAAWLAKLLHQLVPKDPEVAGLHALILLIDARRCTRVDSDGIPVLLGDQDRSQWDSSKIAQGLAALSQAHAAGVGGPYQLQAAIAAVHATAPSLEQTAWTAIVGLYDALLGRRATAVLALNRAVAVSQAEGPAAGLAAIDAIATTDGIEGDLSEYVYFHSARAEMLNDLGEHDESITAFDCALAVCGNEAERTHLRRRRQATHPTSEPN